MWDATKDNGELFGQGIIDKEPLAVRKLELDAKKVDGLGVGVLGSGSDYTVFLQRLGVCIHLVILNRSADDCLRRG